MKKLIAVCAAAALVALAGCKTQPTVETMYNTSLAVGYSAATVANQIQMETKVRNTIVDVLNIVHTTVPKVGETFEQAWMPIAERHIQILIDEETLTPAQGALVKAGFVVVVKGLDYIFVRYPKAKEVEELVKAAIDGFSTGFLEVFKPENCEDCCEDGSCCELKGVGKVIDMEAYRWIKGAANVK